MYRILVPLDGSALAESAIVPACAIARHANGSIDLLVAHVPELFVTDGEMIRGQTPRMLEEEYLKRTAEQASAESGVLVTRAIANGNAVDKICGRARQLGACLIVMTTHGRTGFSRAWMGSVADGVVRESKIPVLLIRARDNAVAGTPALRHFLAALDGSALAEQVLTPVLRQLASQGATLTLVQVVRPIPQTFVDPVVPYAVIPGIIDDATTAELIRNARAYLDGVAANVATRCAATVQTRVIVDRSPANGILALADEVHADAVALTTHGRGMSRLLVGSVADKVLRGTTVPLLLFRPRVRKAARLADRVTRRVKEALPRDR
jgi:nucleotide-binding universal stress UspA family protein